jgi:hypothetical protein
MSINTVANKHPRRAQGVNDAKTDAARIEMLLEAKAGSQLQAPAPSNRSNRSGSGDTDLQDVSTGEAGAAYALRG